MTAQIIPFPRRSEVPITLTTDELVKLIRTIGLEKLPKYIGTDFIVKDEHE